MTDTRNIMLIKVVDVTMHNKTCFGSFNVKQTLRERKMQEYRLSFHSITNETL